jgi:hypothetical protein
MLCYFFAKYTETTLPLSEEHLDYLARKLYETDDAHTNFDAMPPITFDRIAHVCLQAHDNCKFSETNVHWRRIYLVVLAIL